MSGLTGFALARAIPSDCLIGVVTGAYKVCGGVIRDHAGRIVAHLIDAGNMASGFSPAGTVASAVIDAVNAAQLYKIGRNLKELQVATAQLIQLAQGTMVLSGLTLAVSSASFVFLSRKLNQVDQKLNEVAKDVKAIKVFLQSQERAALATALKTLSGILPDLDDKTRIPLLVSARQTLGEIHQRYRDQLVHVDRIDDVGGVEEYYTVTALGHALCSAELDMPATAVSDLDEAYATWMTAARRIATDMVFGSSPERFLCSAYGSSTTTGEIIDWLDFAHGTDKGIAWIDDLRSGLSPFRLPQVRPSAADSKGIDAVRKLSARSRIYEGYMAQYRYLELQGMRPSVMHQRIESLDPAAKLGECFLLVADNMEGHAQRR